MDSYSASETLDILGDKAADKAKLSPLRILALGVIGGAFIAFGYLAFIRVTGSMPTDWSGISSLLGACLFPIGLIGIYFVGGELITGNMMTMTIGVLQHKIKVRDLVADWVLVMLGNAIGGIVVAFLFGHIVGLTEGSFLLQTLSVADGKMHYSALIAFLSGIGCNIFVCFAVWLGTRAKSYLGKMFGLWFPVMVFVLIGFQHVVANAFIVPAALFSGSADFGWAEYLYKSLFVFLGNALGGSLVFAVPVYLIYGKSKKSSSAH